MSSKINRADYIRARCSAITSAFKQNGDGRLEDELREDAYDLATIEADLLGIVGVSGEGGPQPLLCEELYEIPKDSMWSNSLLLASAVRVESLSRALLVMATIDNERLDSEQRLGLARCKETAEHYRALSIRDCQDMLREMLEAPGEE